jgi:hypothetical protein
VAPGGVVVIDFGIAVALDATTLTHSGVIGTPGWLAPEQVRGERVTFATDSFAWGTLAMYTTTGRHPFGSPDQGAAAYLYRIVHEPPDLEGLPPELYGIVSSALSRDPAVRPTSDVLVRALLPVAPPNAHTAPLRTPGPTTEVFPSMTPTESSTTATAVRQPRKGRRWLAAAGVIGLLLFTLVGVGHALLRHPRGPDAQTTTTNPTAKASSAALRTSSPPRTTAPRTTAPRTTAPRTTPPLTTAASAPSVLPVSVTTCLSGLAAQGSAPPAAPTSMNAPAALAPDVGGYSDGLISMLAPAGWTCSGSNGADGNMLLGISPASSSQASDPVGVSAFVASAGLGPAIYQACPYFATAAATASQRGIPCQKPPGGEIVHQGGANFVEIQDPPAVSSGYPTNGVVVWDLSTEYSARAVCTLPEQQHAVCTAVLNDFLDRYGTPPSSSPSAGAETTTASTTPATTPPGPIPLFTTCGPAAYEPSQIYWCTSLCSGYMTNITWTSWTTNSATGYGTWITNDGKPDCQQGTRTAHHNYPVLLSDPGPCGSYGTVFLDSNLYGPVPETGCAG